MDTGINERDGGKLWFPNSNRNSHENDNRICTCKIFLLKNCFKMYKVNIINIYVKPKVACSDRFLLPVLLQNSECHNFCRIGSSPTSQGFFISTNAYSVPTMSLTASSLFASLTRTRQHAHAHQHYELLTLLGVQ